MKFWQCQLSDEQLDKNKQLAKQWHKEGKKPDLSWSIGDFPTAGYGQLDDHGYFEYPLSVNFNTFEIK